MSRSNRSDEINQSSFFEPTIVSLPIVTENITEKETETKNELNDETEIEETETENEQLSHVE